MNVLLLFSAFSALPLWDSLHQRNVFLCLHSFLSHTSTNFLLLFFTTQEFPFSVPSINDNSLLFAIYRLCRHLIHSIQQANFGSAKRLKHTEWCIGPWRMVKSRVPQFLSTDAIRSGPGTLSTCDTRRPLLDTQNRLEKTMYIECERGRQAPFLVDNNHVLCLLEPQESKINWSSVINYSILLHSEWEKNLIAWNFSCLYVWNFTRPHGVFGCTIVNIRYSLVTELEWDGQKTLWKTC